MNYYTFYLLNGNRKVFLGSDPQDAYTNNQCYKDSQEAIAYIDEGITNNYKWDSEHQSWVIIKPFEIKYSDIETITNLKLFFSLQLLQCNEIIVTFQEGSRLILSVKWDNVKYGWLNFIEIKFQHCQTCHQTKEQSYIDTGHEYYSSNQGTEAIEAFVYRVNNNPSVTLADSISYQEECKDKTLEDIYDAQSSIAMYNWEMTDTQKLWLLGCFIKRLEGYPDIDKYLVNTKQGRFICKPGVDVDILLRTIMDQVDYLCDLLITQNGQRNYSFEQFITKHFGFKFTVGESDSFGVLSMIIHTQKGKLVYG